MKFCRSYCMEVPPVARLQVEIDEEFAVWCRTPRPPFVPRIPFDCSTVLYTFADLQSIARNKRADARQVVRDAADAATVAAVAAAAAAALPADIPANAHFELCAQRASKRPFPGPLNVD